MKEIIDFLNKNRLGALATLDKDQPRVRPFEFMFEENGKLYFITSNNKSVYNQLQENNKIEFSVTPPNLLPYVRLTGNVKFSDDFKVKEKALEISPLAKQVYKNADNPIIVAFYLDNGEAVITHTPGTPPTKYNI